MPSTYGALWEKYWNDLPAGFGQAFWDAAPGKSAALHLPLFQSYFDPGLPLVDLGCGNGTQSPFLARHYTSVIGVDISASAIEQAKLENPAPRVSYELLDVLDTAQVNALRERIGPANVYMRAVIHQLSPADRLVCARNLARLAGSAGTVFDQELIHASYEVFERLLAESPDPLPRLSRLSRYFQVGLKTSAAGVADLAAVFAEAGYTVQRSERMELRTSERFADGSELLMPAQYVIARPRG